MPRACLGTSSCHLAAGANCTACQCMPSPTRVGCHRRGRLPAVSVHMDLVALPACYPVLHLLTSLSAMVHACFMPVIAFSRLAIAAGHDATRQLDMMPLMHGWTLAMDGRPRRAAWRAAWRAVSGDLTQLELSRRPSSAESLLKVWNSWFCQATKATVR